jgi:hypothetical protein
MQWYKADSGPKEKSARVAMQDDGLNTILYHKPLPGAQLCYFIHVHGQPIALLGFSVAWQTASRDRYIGWSHDLRQMNLHLIVNKASVSCSRPLPATMQTMHAS